MLHLRCNCGNVSGRSEESRWSSCWGFPGSSKIWLHKWSWWSFPTAHIASLQPPHMHPQIDTLIANIRICISSNPSLSFQDKKDRAQTRRCCTAGFFSQTSDCSFPCRDGLKMTSTTGASLIFIGAQVRVSCFSLPVCYVAYSLESTIQHLEGAARCHGKRFCTW